jgi:DNA-binding NarL/FixJ family response regulator
VDHREIIHLAFRALLGPLAWVERCLAASSVEQAARLSARFDPDVAIVSMARGHRIARQISAVILTYQPTAKVLLMVDFGEVTAAELKEAAAQGFIPQDWEGQRIAETIRRLAAGTPPLGPREERRLGLSARQHEILVRVATGATNPEIAAALHLSRETIKDELSKIYRKLGVRNRVEAAAFAERIGIRH